MANMMEPSRGQHEGLPRPPQSLAVGALTAAVGILAIGALAQDIDLSGIDAGLGGFVINGESANNRAGMGTSVAGDVNGDGLADLVVGAPYVITPGRGATGRVYVVFGASAGIDIQLSEIAGGSSTLGFVINGEAVDDRAGFTTGGAGDINGDGLADIILGAPRSPATVGASAGRAYVVFGKSDGDPVDLTEVSSGTSVWGFIMNGQQAGSYGARDVAGAGDVNGDGLADVIVGEPFGSVGTSFGCGRAYVVFGRTSTASIDLSDIDAGIGGYVLVGQAASDRAGSAVSGAGDVNGDGWGDIIVGAPMADPNGLSSSGRSYVIFGKSDTNRVELSTVAAGTGGFAIIGQTFADYSGTSVSSAGDTNGDGLADLLVGAPLSNLGLGTDSGRAYVVFGKADGAEVDLDLVASGIGGFAISGQTRDDRAGTSVSSAGDVNGDGLLDSVVGAPISDPPTGGSGNNVAGRSYLVLGKTDTSHVALLDVDQGMGGVVINGQAGNDRSGLRVSGGGDVNGDGLADALVAAPESDPAAGVDAGRIYVVFSPYTPATTAAFRGQVAAGNPNRQGIGIHRFGDDATIFPDSRAWVDFDAGSGPGLAGSSEVVATITRNDAALAGLAPMNCANVQWQFTTNRTGWSACRVTVRYTDAEIAGLAEGSLVLYTAPTAAGPFVPAANFTLTPTRNEAAGEVASMPAVFALSTVPPGVFLLDGDANDDGSIDIADVTAIHNDLAGIASLTPDGAANLANIGGVSVGAANAILDHLANGAPLP